MATVVNFDDEDKKNQNAGQSSSSTNTPLGGNPSAAPTVAAPSASTPTSSGRFTNIQNYFNANQPLANQMGNQVASNIEKNGQNVSTSLNGAKDTFNTQAQAGRLDKVPSLASANDTITNAGQQVYGDGNDANTDAINKFQRISSGQYLGPQGLQNSGSILANAQDARTQGDLTANEPGRFTLLRNMFGTPNYSSGQTRLDQLLLGNQTGALNQARQSVIGLPKLANQGSEQAQMQANYYNQEANDVGNTVRNQLSGATNTSTTDLNNAVKAAQDAELARENGYQDISNNLRDNGTIEAADASRLGLGAAGSTVNTYGVNPLDYIKTVMDTTPIDTNTVSTRQQAAQANALAQLAGGTNPIDFSKVGTFKGSTQELDPAYFEKIAAGKANYDALQGQEDAVNAKYGNLQNIYNSLSNSSADARNAAVSGKTPQQGVLDANAAVSNSPQFDQLLQALYGGQKARDVGFLNQAGQDVNSRKAAEDAALEAQLAGLRTKFNISPEKLSQS